MIHYHDELLRFIQFLKKCAGTMYIHIYMYIYIIIYNNLQLIRMQVWPHYITMNCCTAILLMLILLQVPSLPVDHSSLPAVWPQKMDWRFNSDTFQLERIPKENVQKSSKLHHVLSFLSLPNSIIFSLPNSIIFSLPIREFLIFAFALFGTENGIATLPGPSSLDIAQPISQVLKNLGSILNPKAFNLCWWLKSHSQPPGMVLKPYK